MALSLGQSVSINKLAKPTYPRTIYHFKGENRIKHFTSASIGDLEPFCCYPVKPNDTFSIDTAMFVKMDISAEVPLDDIQVICEYYYAPYRILFDDFKQVVGDKDPNDNTTYTFPKTKITFGDATPSNNMWTDQMIGALVLPKLGYGIALRTDLTNGYTVSISSNPLVMLAKIYNHNYRDTLLQNMIPFQNLINNVTPIVLGAGSNGAGFNNLFYCPTINRSHDFFSDGYSSPNFDGDISLNLDQPLPVSVRADIVPGVASNPYDLKWQKVNNGGTAYYPNGNLGQNSEKTFVTSTAGTPNNYVIPANLWTETSALTINQLIMAFSLYNYQFKKQSFGTHYDDYIYAQYGLEVPMSLIDEVECLASTVTTLNQVPVLNQGDQSNLGDAVGFSSTLLKGASFTKSFIEPGLLMGVMAFRVAKHIYGQGYNPHVWDLTDDLDLPVPAFLNIGRVTNPMVSIFNSLALFNDNTNTKGAFNFIDAYDEFRKPINRTSGLFAPIVLGGSVDNLVKFWTYQDIYATAPIFSSSWLYEDPNNVKRTLTGRLIPQSYAPLNSYAQQFLVEIAQEMTIAQVMPGRPVPAHLVNQLK